MKSFPGMTSDFVWFGTMGDAGGFDTYDPNCDTVTFVSAEWASFTDSFISNFAIKENIIF